MVNIYDYQVFVFFEYIKILSKISVSFIPSFSWQQKYYYFAHSYLVVVLFLRSSSSPTYHLLISELISHSSLRNFSIFVPYFTSHLFFCSPNMKCFVVSLIFLFMFIPLFISFAVHSESRALRRKIVGIPRKELKLMRANVLLSLFFSVLSGSLFVLL